MRHPQRTLVAAAAAAALGLGALAATSTTAQATGNSGRTALGLSADGKKVSTIGLTTGFTYKTAKVSGLSNDTELIGIDQRPADSKFYGVGNAGGVYTLSASTGKATLVSQLSVALQGADFGVDFNPAADRLRVISDTGQNLRHDVAASATTVDGVLAYTPGTAATGLTAAAYTNNDNDPSTGTTLFDIDTALDQVVQQVPANAGTLVLSGKLGLDASAQAGFDIVSTTSKGVTTSNVGYAALRAAGSKKSTLYKIDLLSGKASKVGFVSGDVADLAIPQR